MENEELKYNLYQPVLQKIRNKLIIKESPKGIIFKPKDLDELHILFKLERDEKIFKIRDTNATPIDFSSLEANAYPGSFVLDINLAEFNNKYEKIKLLKSPEKDDVKGLAKLNFFPDDDLVEYKGESKKVKGKGRALLTMFSKSKGIPFTASEIARKCNSTINNSFHYFRSDKDIYDTIEHLKKKLKVKKSEYFPIYKLEGSWIWAQK